MKIWITRVWNPLFEFPDAIEVLQKKVRYFRLTPPQESWRHSRQIVLSGALPLMYPAPPGLSPSDRPPGFALVRSSALCWRFACTLSGILGQQAHFGPRNVHAVRNFGTASALRAEKRACCPDLRDSMHRRWETIIHFWL